MLEEVRKSYLTAASIISQDWQTTDVNTLCNLYIENEEDESLRSGYFAAIVLKKWGCIGRYYLSSKSSGFTIDDCYHMVIEAILYILKARKWKDPSNKLYGDKTAPDKCLNRCIFSARRRDYYLANRQKRKLNFGGNSTSLDSVQEAVGDHSMVFSNSRDTLYTPQDVNQKIVINSLFRNNRGLEGVIIDNIIHADCFVTRVETTIDKEGNPYKKSYDVFKLYKLVNNISKYDESKIKNICASYGVSEDAGNEVLKMLKSCDKNKLSRIIKTTIDNMGKDKALKEALCC